MPRIGLVARDPQVITAVEAGCVSSFEVCRYSPSELAETLIQWAAAKQPEPSSTAITEGLRTLSALLVEWCPDFEAQLTTLLVGARARTRLIEETVPIVALCAPVYAERVAALMVGADFVVPPAIQSAQLQALQAAYRRRTERKGQEPAPKAPGEPGRSTERTPQATIEIRDTASFEPSSGDGVRSPSPHVASADATDEWFRIGPILINLGTRTLRISGVRMELTRRPFDLFMYLVRHVDECCTRDELLESVWNLDFDPATNVVDVQICELRAALAEHDLEEMIETVRGRGYRLRWPI